MQILSKYAPSIINPSYKAIHRKTVVRECQTYIAAAQTHQLEVKHLLICSPAEAKLSPCHQLPVLVIGTTGIMAQDQLQKY